MRSVRGDCTRLPLEPSAGNATRGHLCHNGTHGSARLDFADTNERAMLLRVGGPHPQTHIFRRHGDTSWVARFRLCESGTYTAFVLLVTTPSPFLRRDSCPLFHTPDGTLLRSHEWKLSDERAVPVPASSCADGLWRWELADHRDHMHLSGKSADALRAAAAACAGSWSPGEGCEARNRSLTRNLLPPARPDSSAQVALSNITLTGAHFIGRHGHNRQATLFATRHPLGATLERAYAELTWTPHGVTSTRERWRRMRSGGDWRRELPPGGCACFLGDSSTRELVNRLVQRWSAECHQVEMHDAKALCASGGALALVWVRFGLESFFRSPPTNSTLAQLLHSKYRIGELVDGTTHHEVGAENTASSGSGDGGNGGGGAGLCTSSAKDMAARHAAPSTHTAVYPPFRRSPCETLTPSPTPPRPLDQARFGAAPTATRVLS